MAPLVAIFAHPDDEAFGPSGTLAKLAKTRDVYLICVTDGSAGINSSNQNRSLAEIRKEELLTSATILGIKDVFFLGFKDGMLANNLYNEVAEKIQKKLEELRPDTLLTYEHRGISGHLDHIAVSMITSFVFEKATFVKACWYFCIDEAYQALFKKNYPNFFIYLPKGYKKSEISHVEDVSATWEQKIKAISTHKSQQHDVEKMMEISHALPKEENFIIREKNGAAGRV